MTAEQLEKTMALITPTTSYDGFDQVDIVVEAVFENMDLKKSDVRGAGDGDAARLRARVEHVDARHRRVRAGERPAGAGHRPPLLQPGERHEAARDRPRPRDQQGSHRHVGEARQAHRQGRRSSSATASASSPTGCSPTTCARRTCCSRRARASTQIDRVLTDFGMPVGPFGMQDIAGIDVGARIRQYLRVDRQDARGGAAVGGARPAVRDGPLRAEDRRRLVQVRGRAAATGIPDPLVERDRGGGSGEARHHAARRSSDDEILARITTALANEGARVLEDGYAHARRRHRRHLLLRLRLPAPPRRPDVLRRHGRPADGPGARARSTARGSATTGSRRRCSSGSSPRAAGFTASEELPA